jgi:hypothetical protein
MDSGARWPHDATLHAWWVEPGRLLAGEYFGAQTPDKTRQKVDQVRAPEQLSEFPVHVVGIDEMRR